MSCECDILWPAKLSLSNFSKNKQTSVTEHHYDSASEDIQELQVR